ncbi:MAG: right-handed parallel beta-helix repeat-containing protein [Fuerstiella sp.]
MYDIQSNTAGNSGADRPVGDTQRLCFLKIIRQAVSSTLIAICVMGCTDDTPQPNGDFAAVPAGPVYVGPDQDLQKGLDDAAAASEDRRLILRPGTYQTSTTRFCLLAITAIHDGVTVEGQEGAILSARSPDTPDAASVSHVVYCGDGVSSKTRIRNLTITGAKGLATNGGVPLEDFEKRTPFLKRGLFYYMDGGALKIFGQSSPVFEKIDFVDNVTQLCGGAVSIEQQGFQDIPPVFTDCRFMRNRCPATGSAVDVLQGSSVKMQNCLFVDNVGNYGMSEVLQKYNLSYNETHGSGALTVFPGSRAQIDRCTFLGNWNAVDDRGVASEYSNTIFASNDASDGSRPGHPYEIDIVNADGVDRCFFHSKNPDLKGNVSRKKNVFDAGAPMFVETYVPANAGYAYVGFRQ